MCVCVVVCVCVIGVDACRIFEVTDDANNDI